MGRYGATVESDRARVVAVDPEDGAGDLTAPGPDESGEADDLTGAYREGDVVEDPGGGQAPHVENDVADRAGVREVAATSRPTIRATISDTEVSSIRSVEM